MEKTALIDSVFDIPAHLEMDDGRFRAWFTRPHGLMTQVAVATNFTRQHFALLSDDLYAGLLGRAGNTAHRFVFLHDWTRITGYDPDVQDKLTEWTLHIRDRIEAVFVDPGRDATLRMAANAQAAPLRSAGTRFEVVSDLHAVATRLHLSVLASVP